MKAMIFAAGLGTRLRPITDTIPKALVEVGGVPMLGRVLLKLKAAGVDEAIVNIHHFPDLIRSYLAANSGFGITIHISDETPLLLDTGGGILAARKWLDDGAPFIVHNADILTDFNVADMMAAHNAAGADVTLLGQQRTTSRHFLFDSGMRLVGWANTATHKTIPENLDCSSLQPLAFGGVSIVSPAVFPLLERYSESAGRVFSTTPFYASYAAALDIRAHIPANPYRWFDIGKPATLAEARASYRGSTVGMDYCSGK